MNDVALIYENGCFDIQVKDGDLVSDDGLETAIIISLFTDRRATTEQLPSGITTRKGWWGDLFPDVDKDQIGSRLWTILREKRINSTLVRAEEYCNEALEWTIEDGVASEVSVTATFEGQSEILLNIILQRPTGENSRFGFVWDGQELKRG